MPESWTHHRARIAAAKRWQPDADTTAIEGEFADAVEQARLDRHIDELVASAPRMTAEQRDRLSRLFRYGAAG
jgi:hypothetical protein